jgi:hypothetical protein
MSRKMWLVPTLGAVLVIGLVLGTRSTSAAAGDNTDQVKLASLVNDMKSLDSHGLAVMQPIPIRQYEVPGPGVDVMRARIEETYTIDGVGTDTVQLSGWIAVTHGQAYTSDGAKEVRWDNAILPTQFVDMDMNGESKLFGKVHIGLNKDKPVFGKVGRITIPELAQHNLQAKLEKNDAAAANQKALAAQGKVGQTPNGKPATPKGKVATPPPAALCDGEIPPFISISQLGLEMTTQQPVHWYSLVDTIPPVGHTASITIEPVRMYSHGRAVGTLVSGEVKFREVVRHVSLSRDAGVQLAAK